MSDHVAARVVEEASRIAGPSRTPLGASPDTPLAEGGFELDSVEILELIVATELGFGIEIDPAALLPPEALRDPRGLAHVVESSLRGPGRERP